MNAVKISPDVALKIFDKHGVLMEEIYDLLGRDCPIFRKVAGDQYLAIGLSRSRYLTTFFRYDLLSKEVEIATAYPSSKDQVRFYKKQCKRR